MGKLILGIIAVTLLQISLFVYTELDRADVAKAEKKTTQLPDKISVPSLASQAPEDLTLPNSTASATAGRQAIRDVRPLPRDRERVRVPERVHTVPVRRPTRFPAFAKSIRTSKEDQDPAPKRVRSVVPGGHTLILVDYSPAVAKVETREIRRTKKRSYLARAFPAFVKKPWNLIKSIASKLD